MNYLSEYPIQLSLWIFGRYSRVDLTHAGTREKDVGCAMCNFNPKQTKAWNWGMATAMGASSARGRNW